MTKQDQDLIKFERKQLIYDIADGNKRLGFLWATLTSSAVAFTVMSYVTDDYLSGILLGGIMAIFTLMGIRLTIIDIDNAYDKLRKLL